VQLTSSPRRALGLLAAGTIGLSTAVLGVSGVAQASPPTGPNAPTIEGAEGGDTTATVFFTANDPAEDDVVTPWADYFEYSLDDGDTYDEADVDPGMNGFDGGFEIPGLTNGTQYSVTLRGVSEGADPDDPADDIAGAPSDATTVTPYVGASAPGNPVVKVGPASVTVSWTAATAGTFPIKGYTVGSYVSFGEGGGNAQICTTTGALTCTAPVVPGYKYAIYVYAVDSKDNGGADSDVSAQTVAIPPASVPATVPTKNGDLVMTAGKSNAVAAGSKVTVTGTGYAPGSTVSVAVYSTPQVLTTAVADANGAFSVEVTVPAGLAAGNHTLVASGVDANGVLRYVTLPVTVTATGSAKLLASTGADVTVPALGGIAALGLGAGLIGVSRRRRTAA
jgi:titin